MPDIFDDLLNASNAAGAALAERRRQAQDAHDATGTGERLGSSVKEGLWGLQGNMAGLVGADETRAEAKASVQASKLARGASADSTGEDVLGSAIESSPMTLASFLPAYLLRVPASRVAASRVLAQATARGMSATSPAVQRIAAMAAAKAGNVASRVGIGGSMGALAMPDAYDEAKDAGLDTGTALANAAGAGLTEGAFTYLMPGGVEAAGLSRTAVPGLARTLGQGARRVGGAVVGEGFEEGSTELAHVAREQALGVQSGPILSDQNMERIGLAAGAGSIMGPAFTAPTVAEDMARQLPQAIAPHLLAARLATAQPQMDATTGAPTEAVAQAPAGMELDQALARMDAAAQARRGLPQDFTPPAVMGETGGALPEQQPNDMAPDDAAGQIAALFQAMPPQAQQQIASLFQPTPQQGAPDANLPPLADPSGAVPAPQAPGATAPVAPVAPQPAAQAAPLITPTQKGSPNGQEDQRQGQAAPLLTNQAAPAPALAGQPGVAPSIAAAPGVPTVTGLATAPANPPAIPESSPTVKESLKVGQRVRFTRGAKQGTEATITSMVGDRPILRTDDGKALGGKFGITPDNLEAINAPAAPNPGTAPVAPTATQQASGPVAPAKAEAEDAKAAQPVEVPGSVVNAAIVPRPSPTTPVVSGEGAVDATQGEPINPPSNARQDAEPVAAQPIDPAPITDLGEKIGGARKDIAGKTGPKGTRPKDDDNRPAWMRRYTIGQIVSSSTPGEEGRWSVRDAKSTDWQGRPRQIGRTTYATKEAAEADLPRIEARRNHVVRMVSRSADAAKEFGIYRKTGEDRVKLVKKGFPTVEAAESYLDANPTEIMEVQTSFGEEILAKTDKANRKGPERRQGDVSPQSFMDTFGFRGVEFGNWNNQAERQEVMNHAYDGLMDLAEAVGIPPKAISLNGELALAFGARGHGLAGARAHYEPSRAVINLTKMKGSGALAHEWWHAVDYYFARQDRGVTPTTTASGQKNFPTDAGDISSSAIRGEGMRPELKASFNALRAAITRKAVNYVEDTAKAEQFVKRSRDNLDEKARKVRENLAKERQYGAKKAPASPEQLAAWDAAADALLNGDPIPVEWKPSGGKGWSNKWTNDHLDAMEAIHKAVTGRSGRSAERRGEIDILAENAKYYHQRVAMMKDANDNPNRTASVPTQYLTDAKEIDQGRSTDYWTTPTELTARAFSAYVEDTLQDQGRASGFLSFGSDNWRYALHQIRPFPEGDERGAINGAFKSFFQTVKTEETPQGTTRLYGPNRTPGDSSEALPEANSDVFGAGPVQEQREMAKAFIKEMDRSPVFNESMGVDIGISGAGLRKVLSSSANPRRLHLLPVLRDILANGTEVPGSMEAPEAGNDTRNVKAYHWLQASVRYDGEVRPVKVRVREDANGFWHYNHDIGDVVVGGNRKPSAVYQGAEPSIQGSADPALAEGTVPGDRPDDRSIPTDSTAGKLYQSDAIPGERLAMPDQGEGIEALIGWALRERERTISEMRQRAERGGDMADEYRRTQADYEVVDPDVLAKDMREFPSHYLRAVTSAGGNMDPVQVYRRRVEMPPQMPRIQPAPVPPTKGEAPDLMATMRSLRDDLRRVSPGAPTLAVDRGALPEQAGGEFDTRTKAITTRYHNDLDLVAHEVGHWASEEYGLLPDATDATARAELARFALHGSKATGDTAQREGMAEYLRAWMVNPAEAEAQAPRFSQIMREKMPGTVADALRSYGDSVRRFEGATALQKMAAGQTRMEPAMAEQRKMGQAWAPVALAVREWLGKGNGEVKARPGAIPSKWEASAMTKARFELTDKEAPQLANYLLSLTLTGQDPASVKPSEHWDYLRKGLRGVAGKLRDGITEHGLPNQDGSAAIDPVTGKPMAMPWLLEQAMASEDVAAFLDKAHAYGSAQRTMELAERFTNKAEEEIQLVAEAAMDEVGNDKFRRRAAEDRVVQFAEERRKQLRMQLARITAAGGGIESATEVARKAVDEIANDPERAAVEEYLRRYRAWADWNLSYAVQSELMSPTQAETIRQANQFYIDWHRVFADDDGPVNLGEAVTGSSRTMHNPLASLLHATWGTVTRGDRNRAMLTFTAPLRSSPASVHGQRALSSLGRQISDQDAEEAKSRHQGYKDDGAGGKQRVYQVQRTVQEVNDEGQPLTGPNGEPMQRIVTDHWVFDPATEASMEAMRAMGGDSFVPRLMQSMVNLQRLAITSAPSFRFKVPVRDNIERMLNSQVNSGPADALRGLGQMSVTDPLTGEDVPVDRLFSQSGASMAGWSQRTREQAMADVFAHVADMRKNGWRVMTPGGAWRWWQEFGEKAENIARKAEFVAAFQKARKPTTAGGLGYSQLDASLYAMTQARGLLDTAESGRTIGQINRVFLFVNAATKGLQRTSKIARLSAAAYHRGDIEAGNKLAGLMAVRLAVWGGSLYALRVLILGMMDDKDQEEMLQAPAWKRDFSVMLPDFGMGKVAIAKPYEWGFIGSGFERLADATWASQKADTFRRQGRTADAQRWGEYADRSHEGWAHSGMTALLPLKFDDVLGGGLTPVAEVAMNRSLFTGGTIIPTFEADKRLELRDRAKDASVAGRGLSSVLAPVVGDRFGDPRSIDHLIRGYLGGWGSAGTAKDWGEVARKFTGYSGETSPYAERDMGWVMDWAAKNGQAGKSMFTNLRALAKKAREAKGEAQDEALARMRRAAENLRRGIEQGRIKPEKP